MSKIKVERSTGLRKVKTAEVGSKGRGRPLAELVEKIERADPDLTSERRLSRPQRGDCRVPPCGLEI